MNAPAPTLHEAYWVDCYAAAPGGHVLDPGYHRIHPVELVSGAQILIARHHPMSTVVGLHLDFANAGDPGGHLGGGVCLDGEALSHLWQACGYFRRTDQAEHADINVSDDAEEYHGHYGDDRPPDMSRTLRIGRDVRGDAMVYLLLDLAETHGITPTVWLDRDGLRDLAEAAGYLMESL